MELHRRGAGLRRALGLALALALVACGGGGGDERSDPTADDDTARAANLRLTDFPPGWERAPAPVRRLDTPEDRRFAECMGRPFGPQVRTGAADSDNFATGEFTRANSSVQVVRTEAIARDDHAALRGDRAIPCLRERLDAELARQAPSGGARFEQQTLQRLDVPNVADDTVGFRVTVLAPSVGPGVVLYVDEVFFGKGRVELSAAFIERDRPFSTDLEQQLIAKMASRARVP